MLTGLLHQALREVENAFGEALLVVSFERRRRASIALQSGQSAELRIVALLRIDDVEECELPESDEEGRSVHLVVSACSKAFWRPHSPHEGLDLGRQNFAGLDGLNDVQ